MRPPRPWRARRGTSCRFPARCLPLRRILMALGDAVLVHPGENVGRPPDLLVAEAPRLLQPMHHRPRELLCARMDGGQRLAGPYPGTHRRLHDDARSLLDWIFFLLSPHAELQPPPANRPPVPPL